MGTVLDRGGLTPPCPPFGSWIIDSIGTVLDCRGLDAALTSAAMAESWRLGPCCGRRLITTRTAFESSASVRQPYDLKLVRHPHTLRPEPHDSLVERRVRPTLEPPRGTPRVQ
jgi:hypothetical protein